MKQKMTKSQRAKAKKKMIGKCLPNGSVIFRVTFDGERKKENA